MWHKIKRFLRWSHHNSAKRRHLALRLHHVIFVDTLEGLLESQSRDCYSRRLSDD